MNLSEIDAVFQVVQQCLTTYGENGQITVRAGALHVLFERCREAEEKLQGTEAYRKEVEAENKSLVEKLEAATTEAHRKAEHLEASYHEQRLRAEKAEAELVEAHGRVDELSEKLARKSLGTLSEEAEELKAKVEAAKAEKEVTEQQNQTLYAKVEELRAKVRELEDSKPQSFAEVASQTTVSFVASQNARIEELETALRHSERHVLDLKAEIQALEERLRQKIEESNHAEAGMGANLEEAELEATVQGAEAAKVEGQVAKLEARVERLLEASLGVVEVFQRLTGNNLPLEVERLRRAVYDQDPLEEAEEST